MNDLKLYARDNLELEGLLQTVKSFSGNIAMQFGLDKCAKTKFNSRNRITAINTLAIPAMTKQF